MLVQRRNKKDRDQRGWSPAAIVYRCIRA